MATLRGSCQCGAVRFELPAQFESMSFCHCTTCKKISGGVGTANGRVRTDSIRLLAGEDVVRTFQPDEGSAKTFCSVCGSNLLLRPLLIRATRKLDEAVRKISDRQESATSGRSLLRFNDRNVGLRLDRNA